jgi:hypothetical protein
LYPSLFAPPTLYPIMLLVIAAESDIGKHSALE